MYIMCIYIDIDKDEDIVSGYLFLINILIFMEINKNIWIYWIVCWDFKKLKGVKVKIVRYRYV